MSALARLLPEAAGKLPKQVVRNPFLLVKSPRALARSILQVRSTQTDKEHGSEAPGASAVLVAVAVV
jgi:hypothetical protein